jgi:hypothetical protein
VALREVHPVNVGASTTGGATGTIVAAGTTAGGGLDPGETSQRLLHALPDLVVLRGDIWDSPLIALLGVEIVKDEPGQEVVLDRLLDLLLIAVLRAWFSRPEVLRSNASAASVRRNTGGRRVSPTLVDLGTSRREVGAGAYVYIRVAGDEARTREGAPP